MVQHNCTNYCNVQITFVFEDLMSSLVRFLPHLAFDGFMHTTNKQNVVI